MKKNAKFGITPVKQAGNFKPNALQEQVFKELFLNRKTGSQLPQIARHPGKRTFYGYDVAERGGDKTVVTRAKVNSRGQITMVVFDEYMTIPTFKWYRNPIQWWKWRKIMKGITRQAFKAEWRDK